MSAACRLPPPPLTAAAGVQPTKQHIFHLFCCRSTPLPDWDLPDDKPDFNTRTNDKLVQNDANQTLSAAGKIGAVQGCPSLPLAVACCGSPPAPLADQGWNMAAAKCRLLGQHQQSVCSCPTTTAEIEAMKASGAAGADIVAALAANSATFAAKTEFSQEKYK